MKLQQSTRVAALLSAIAFAAGLSAAEPTDFSTYSTDELVELRSQMQKMTEEDRLLFRMEMQRRARAMRAERRAETGIRPEAARSRKPGPDPAPADPLRDGTDPAHGRAADYPPNPRGEDSGPERKGDGSEGNGRAADFQPYGSGYRSRRGQNRTGHGRSPHGDL